MNKFITDMECLDIYKEFKNCNSLNYTSHYLFRNCREISYNRKQVSIFLEGMLKDNSEISKKYIEEFNQLSIEWDTLKNLIAMMFFTKSNDELKECVKKIKCIYKREMSLVKSLMEEKEKYE